MSGRGRRWARRARFVLGVSAGTVVLVFLMECGLHAVGYAGMERFCADPVLGFALYPDQQVQDLTTLQPVSVNSAGWRGPEPRETPADLRVACFGDSVTFGRGVLDHQTYPALLQRLLGALPGGRTGEVRNYGVPGHGVVHARAWMEARWHTFDPHVLIVAQTWNNHWLPGSPEELTALAEEIGPGLRMRNQLKRTATFHWAMRTWLSLGLFPLYDAVRNRVYGAELADTEAEQAFGANLDAIATVAEEQGALLVLVRIPPDAGFDEVFLRHGTELAALDRAVLVDMGPRFEEEGEKGFWVTRFDPHPDAGGHQAIAFALDRALGDRLEQPPASPAGEVGGQPLP